MVSAHCLPPLHTVTGLRAGPLLPAVPAPPCRDVHCTQAPKPHQAPSQPLPKLGALEDSTGEGTSLERERVLLILSTGTMNTAVTPLQKGPLHPIHCAGFSPPESVQERVLHPTSPPSVCAQHEHTQGCWRGQCADCRHLCMHTQTEQLHAESRRRLWAWSHTRHGTTAISRARAGHNPLHTATQGQRSTEGP